MIRVIRINLVVVLVIFSIILTACSTGDNSDSSNKFPYPELLSKEEGRYSIFVVYPKKQEEEIVSLLKTSRKIKSIRGEDTLEMANELFPRLNINRVPMVFIFDTEKIVFKTSDYDKAIEFVENN
ncbi:hypothetical protein L1765_00830 [Microaerobacter geothermalis]|uniref:hypothetical protein n=1 Tax=Microaerobacter geothermalis TaxID=674972 RepID=UPI001F2F2212|nr:hypothetical protein [Microaerobacter geothermalis]MCF6092536.1 hypothetical protein [Microaerobacter geothermalis]